jgi:hypothetical protein
MATFSKCAADDLEEKRIQSMSDFVADHLSVPSFHKWERINVGELFAKKDNIFRRKVNFNN